jgi:hypothetical protein
VKHPGVAVTVLIAFLMQGTVAISHAAENIPIPDSALDVATEKNAEALPGSLSVADKEDATIRRTEFLLTPEEQTALTMKEAAQTPEFMYQIGGGCREVWSNERQRNETQCANPAGYVLGGAFFGGLIGSFGGAAGAAAGAVVGSGIMYGMYKLTGYE